MKFTVTSLSVGLNAALVMCYGISGSVIEGWWKGQVKLLHASANIFNACMGHYLLETGLTSVFLMIIGGNTLLKSGWFTAAVITPTLTLAPGRLFFSYIIWRNSFGNMLAQIGTTPVAVAAFIRVVIFTLGKSTKSTLLDLIKGWLMFHLTTR
jgi:AAA family ATP:ADP antiporter